jgi:hypothetical protein
MSQRIILPSEIISTHIDTGESRNNNIFFNGKVMKVTDYYKLIESQIQAYTREVAMVTAILSERCLNDIIALNTGYMDAIDLISKWAVEFIETYAHVTEWDSYCNDNDVSDWHEFVCVFSAIRMQTYKHQLSVTAFVNKQIDSLREK